MVVVTVCFVGDGGGWQTTTHLTLDSGGGGASSVFKTWVPCDGLSVTDAATLTVSGKRA